MTYKLWHNGAEYGPLTQNEVRDRYQRGELVGVLWRRVGQTQYQPHTELEAELAEPVAPPGAVREPEPSGDSVGGQIAIVCGVLLFVIALAGAIAIPLLATLSGAGLVAIVVGYLAQIHAKLELIAHRLRRH